MVKSPTSAYYSPETRIILITPPPVNTKQWGTDRVFESTRSYAVAVKEVGERENVPVADIWTQMFDGAGRSEEGCAKYLYDGLHLNSDGYNVRSNCIQVCSQACSLPSKIVFQSLVNIIDHVYPELNPEGGKLQNVFMPCVLSGYNFCCCADAHLLAAGTT